MLLAFPTYSTRPSPSRKRYTPGRSGMPLSCGFSPRAKSSDCIWRSWVLTTSRLPAGLPLDCDLRSHREVIGREAAVAARPNDVRLSHGPAAVAQDVVDLAQALDAAAPEAVVRVGLSSRMQHAERVAKPRIREDLRCFGLLVGIEIRGAQPGQVPEGLEARDQQTRALDPGGCTCLVEMRVEDGETTSPRLAVPEHRPRAQARDDGVPAAHAIAVRIGREPEVPALRRLEPSRVEEDRRVRARPPSPVVAGPGYALVGGSTGPL